MPRDVIFSSLVSLQVLCLATSNMAVDNLVEGLLKRPDWTKNVVRLGHIARTKQDRVHLGAKTMK